MKCVEAAMVLAIGGLGVPLAQAFQYDAGAGTLALDFQKSTEAARPAGARLAKRSGKAVGESISWGGLLYYINITLGTPGQSSAVWLDTGSSDLWLPDTGSNICETSQAGCSSNGGFDPGHSKTYKTISKGTFSIQYASGDDITGDYGQDTLAMDDATIQDMIFGSANKGMTSTPLSGIMGIGYTLGESSTAQNETYPNIIDKLVSSGIITSKTYSLYLNDLQSGHGTILFGGVDKDKYSGELGIVNVQETEQTQAFDTFSVVLSKLTFAAGGATNNLDLGDGGLTVILDSGTTLTYLPNDVATSIYNGLGITFDDVDGPYVPCEIDTSNMHFTFTFGSDEGVSIDVDLGQFVLPYDPSAQLPSIDGGKTCSFGLFPAGSVANGAGDILFGDTFLRSAYLVYDLDNNQIAMAPTKFDVTSSQVEAIGANAGASTNTIPAASTVADQVTANQAANPTAIAAEPTAGAEGSAASSTNTVAQSTPATFQGIPTGGLATGTTLPGGSAVTSSSAAMSRPVPAVDWSSIASIGVAGLAALMGSSLFLSWL